MRGATGRLVVALTVAVVLTACGADAASDAARPPAPPEQRVVQGTTDAGPAAAPEPEVPAPPEPATRGVKVIVTDEEGAPIEGATVRVFAVDQSVAWPFGPPRVSQRDPVATADTGDDGSARFEVARDARVTVVVAAPGRVGSAREVAADESETSLRLAPGHVLEGAVTDARGDPVPGARVRIGTSFDSFTGTEPEVVTDENGWYRFDCAPAGVVSVNAAPAGVSSSWVERVLVPSVQRLNVTLDLHGPIRGVVRDPDTRQPIEGATVHAGLGGFHSETVEATAITDAEGRYEIPVWPKDGVGRVAPRKEGWYWRSSPDGEGSTSLPFPGDGPLEVDLWMSRGARIEGVVRGPDGAVQDADVGLYEQGAESRYSTTSDVDGRYSFTGVPKGDYVLIHSHARYLGATYPDDPNGVFAPGGDVPPNGLRIEDDGTYVLDLRLERGRVVNGIVLDADDEPCAGADVYGTNGRRATTDEDGRFELSGFAEREELSVSVAGSGGASVVLPPDAPADALRDVVLRRVDGRDIEVRRTVEVHARVLDRESRPVPGARVAASSFSRIDALRAVTSAPEWGPPAEDDVAVVSFETWGRSDTIGVIAKAPGHAPEALEVALGDADTVDVTMELRPEAVLGGVVTAEDGRPLEGVRVTLDRPDDSGAIGCRIGQDVGPPIVAVTDADGAFEVAGLPGGEVEVHMSAPRVVGGMRRVTLSTGKVTTVCKRLLDPRVLRGHVVDAEGAPVAGVTLRASRGFQSFWDSRTDGDDGRSARATTDDQGAFELRGLGTGKFDVTVTPGGGAAELVEHVVQDVDPAAGVLDVELPPHRCVSGVVADGDGEPVRGATIEYLLSGEREAIDYETTTDSVGRYAVLAPPDADVTLRVIAIGFGERSRVVPSGVSSADFTLGEGLAVAGILRDEDGEPMPASRIEARRVKSDRFVTELPHATTDAEGRFRIVGLEPGEYELCGQYETFDVSMYEPSRVTAGDEGLEVVRLRPAALDVVLVDDRGDALPGLRVRFETKGRAMIVTADQAGRARSTDHRPGTTWRLVVEGVGRPADPSRTISAGADEEPLVIVDTGRASGTVVDAEGDPVPRLALELRATVGTDEVAHHVTTDAAGRFNVRGLTAVEYAVFVADRRERIELADRVEVEDSLTIRLRPAGAETPSEGGGADEDEEE